MATPIASSVHAHWPQQSAVPDFHALRQIVLEECCPLACEALWPHFEVLLNVSDMLWRSPAAEARLRSFLKYLNYLHEQIQATCKGYDESRHQCHIFAQRA